MADCPNALWLTFVDEWVDTAVERNTKGVQTYKKARTSLKACPFPMQHPSETQQLFGWGDGLVKKLTKELENYCDANGIPMPQRQKNKRKAAAGAAGEGTGSGAGDTPSPKKKKARKPTTYVPKLRTGPYAIILALSTLDEGAKVGITKPQLIELAQPHCDASFSAPTGPSQFYTAWNSMKTLISKDLVYEKGRPTRQYFLTDEGWETAKAIRKTIDPSQGDSNRFVSADRPALADSDDDLFVDRNSPVREATTAGLSESRQTESDDVVSQGESVLSDAELPTFSPIILEPGSFTVEMVLDNREVFGTLHRDYIQKNLVDKGVEPIVRGLAVGDVLWVAKLHDPALLQRRGAEGNEVVLDYIVERKRLDDLIGSIKDSRFHEQKFRLRKSGLKNVIYLIEEKSIDTRTIQRYQEHIASAIASTQVVNGFFVKKTQSIDDTIGYLVRMTKLLKEKYEMKPLHLIPTKTITHKNYLPLVAYLEKTQPSTNYHITYDAFAAISSKSGMMTLRDIYLKMLMCSRGVTADKALEIQKRWQTPFNFVEAYEKADEKEGGGEQGKKRKMDMVSSEMSNLIGRKKVGKALSVNISQVWGNVEV